MLLPLLFFMMITMMVHEHYIASYFIDKNISEKQKNIPTEELFN
jgi:hypothetical protein